MKKVLILIVIVLMCICSFSTNVFYSKANAENSVLQKINPNLDSKWEFAFFDQNANSWIAEYGLKGEDVINFKWSKLITVNGLTKMPPAITPKIYAANFKALLDSQAKQMNSSLFFKNLELSQNEEWFIWSIYGRNETEMCRVFRKGGILYHLHYAIKNPKFNEQEFNYAMKTLSNIRIN